MAALERSNISVTEETMEAETVIEDDTTAGQGNRGVSDFISSLRTRFSAAVASAWSPRTQRRNLSNVNCDDDGREGTGFLSRFGQQRQNIIDQLRPTSAEVEHDKFSRREPLDNVRNKTDSQRSSFIKDSIDRGAVSKANPDLTTTPRRSSSIEFEKEALDSLGSMNSASEAAYHSASPFASFSSTSTASSNNGAISINSNSFGRRQLPPPLTRRTQTMSYIDIALHNEDGEKDDVEIDVADDENGDGDVTKTITKPVLPYARRQSISDRLSKRRNSELAAEIIRLSAENRRREFFELLDEHSAIVQEIEKWEPNGICEEDEDAENDKENGS